jgi:hypothetical protein
MVITQKQDRNNGCDGQEPTRTQTHNGTYRPGTWDGSIQGKTDPNADVLSGSRTKVDKYPESETTITHIYNWELYR